LTIFIKSQRYWNSLPNSRYLSRNYWNYNKSNYSNRTSATRITIKKWPSL